MTSRSWPGNGGHVPRYLIVAKYTPEGTKGLLGKGGTARRTAVTEMVEKVIADRIEARELARKAVLTVAG